MRFLRNAILAIAFAALSLGVSACEKEVKSDSSSASASAQPTWLMFYSKNYYLGYVDIYVNNVYRGTVTSWYSYQPACGSAGCVTVQIFGPFTWYAVRRSDGFVYSNSIMTYPGCNAFFFY